MHKLIIIDDTGRLVDLGLDPTRRYTMLAIEPEWLADVSAPSTLAAFVSGSYGGVLVPGGRQQALEAAARLRAAHAGAQPAIGIGRTYKGYTRLAASYQEAVLALEHQLFHGAGGILAYDDLVREQDRHAAQPAYPEAIEHAIMAHLRAGAAEQAQVLLERFFALLPPEPAYLRAASLELASVIIRELAGRGAPRQGQKDRMTRAAIALQSCKTLRAIKEYLAGLMHVYVQPVATPHWCKPRDTIDTARDFIHANLHRDISLEDVAGALHFSSSYLAQIFKKATGKTVVEYITLLKMEQATELLRDPQAKVCAVAEALGYGDRRYFSDLFRRYKGCTPSEYREQFVVRQYA